MMCFVTESAGPGLEFGREYRGVVRGLGEEALTSGGGLIVCGSGRVLSSAPVLICGDPFPGVLDWRM